MKRFKLKPGLSETYEITKENFEVLTKGKDEYNETGKDGKPREFGICPACDNPIQLIGLYKELENTDHPYGKHYGHDIKLAKHNEKTYQFCPYAKRTWTVTKENLKEKVTDFEKGIYYAVRDNFDYAIYLAETITGLKISPSYARQMLNWYLGVPGFMYYHATYYNIPWMLLYFMPAVTVHYKLVKKDSPIYNLFKKCKYINLVETKYGSYYRVEKKDLKMNLEFATLLHRRKVVNDEVKEYIDIILSTLDEEGLPKELGSCTLEINEYRFPNLVHSEKAKAYRNQELLDIAKEMMGDI